MTDPNEPAFATPGVQYGNGEWDNGHAGLTKREYFAAKAMEGYIAAGSSGMPDAKNIATLAVETADRLIYELNKPTE